MLKIANKIQNLKKRLTFTRTKNLNFKLNEKIIISRSIL